jgi:hypothetical protein
MKKPALLSVSVTGSEEALLETPTV